MKSKELDIAIKSAKEGGEILKKYFGNVDIQYKGENFDAASILTQADIKSEKKIVSILKKEFPEHNIYAEEETNDQKNSEYTWYIDPLDGTSNFSRNIPLFGVSIGLVKKDKPILGVLYFPKLNLLIHAEKGKGVFANNKKVQVSKREINKSLYYSGGYYKGQFQMREEISEKIGLTKIIDASSYELAQIAMGDAELYILANVLHDVVAGVIIIQEAGGKVTDYKGKDYTINSEGIVASNKKIHEEVIKLIKPNPKTFS